jgi:hypothetical protein
MNLYSKFSIKSSLPYPSYCKKNTAKYLLKNKKLIRFFLAVIKYFCDFRKVLVEIHGKFLLIFDLLKNVLISPELYKITLKYNERTNLPHLSARFVCFIPIVPPFNLEITLVKILTLIFSRVPTFYWSPLTSYSLSSKGISLSNAILNPSALILNYYIDTGPFHRLHLNPHTLINSNLCNFIYSYILFLKLIKIN